MEIRSTVLTLLEKLEVDVVNALEDPVSNHPLRCHVSEFLSFIGIRAVQ